MAAHYVQSGEVSRTTGATGKFRFDPVERQDTMMEDISRDIKMRFEDASIKQVKEAFKRTNTSCEKAIRKLQDLLQEAESFLEELEDDSKLSLDENDEEEDEKGDFHMEQLSDEESPEAGKED